MQEAENVTQQAEMEDFPPRNFAARGGDVVLHKRSSPPNYGVDCIQFLWLD